LCRYYYDSPLRGAGSAAPEAKAAALSERDGVVLADFDNKTGDAVFDDALKQALAVQLRQSPFLNILSDRKIEETLRLMGQPPTQHVTREIAREICIRTGSKATVLGSISNLGGQYVIGLNAIGCSTGDTLATEQEEAASKQDVLKTLGHAATMLRGNLGESLATVQKFDVPVEATTPSLEALKAYSMGIATARRKGDAEAVPFYKRAIELDPNFAMAYAALGTSYSNLHEATLATEYGAKAYELRDRVSERERYRISAAYFTRTGELEKATEAYELWAKSYPRDYVPRGNLGALYSYLGQYDKAAAETEEGLRLEPSKTAYANLAGQYIALNRLDEAEKILQQGQANGFDGLDVRAYFYVLYFLRGNNKGMEQQMTWAAGRPGEEDLMLSAQSDTEGYYGRLVRARDYSRRAVGAAVRSGAKETAALWQGNAALREAEFGNAAIAKQGANAALALAPGRDVKVLVAMTLARAGDTTGAKGVVEQLEKTASTNTAYIRGLSYLAARNGTAAVEEFKKLIDHPGIVQNLPVGALAHLETGRAYALAGDAGKAKSAYQQFFALWKDADPDIPILKQAKAEYAKLQ
jgi:tetratricopeptide (TPR) repeat protein